MPNHHLFRVALAQITPVWLNRAATLDKVCTQIEAAAGQACQLVVFGEALVPGYPFWLERTDGARFNSPQQKKIFAHYAQQAVQRSAGHLDRVCDLAKRLQIHVMLGCSERPVDRERWWKFRTRAQIACGRMAVRALPRLTVPGSSLQ